MIDFICVGAQKSATTWLSASLDQHPDVWTPFIKEVHYFDVIHLDFSARNRYLSLQQKISRVRSKNDCKRMDTYFDRILDSDFCFTDEWYQHIFSVAPSDSVKGECTPYYCALPLDGVTHIKRLLPDVKIIYLVRDPVDRAISSLRMALAQNPDIDQMKHCSKKAFHRRGDYRNNIPRWDSVFDADALMYLPFGRVKTNPQGVLREAEAFLGLAQYDAYTSLSKKVSASRDHATVSKEAVEFLSESGYEQYQFLNKRFGEEFVRNIG